MTRTHLDDWQPLTIRYGIHDVDDQAWADRQPWGSRHLSDAVHDPVPVHRRCECPATLEPAYPVIGCTQAATQEDLICDECRAWCVCSVGHSGPTRLIVDVWRERQAATR